jgi:hypothetical protein
MPGKNSLSSQKRSDVFGGSITTLVGLGLVLVSLDVIPAKQESFHAPRWVLTMAGMMFTCVGLLILSKGFFSPAEQRDPIVRWIQYFLAIGMLAAFAMIFLWVGFGPGEREFGSSVSFFFLTISNQGNEIIGRILFGGCGLVMALITALAAFGGAHKITTETTDDEMTNE